MPISRNRFVHTSIVSMLLCAILVVSGCIITGVIATIAVVAKAGGGHTITVELEKPPDEVYQAMLRALVKYPEATLLSKDPATRTIEVFKLKNEIKATAMATAEGTTRLIVKASAGEKDQSSEELALKVVEETCKELGVKYQVVRD